MRFPSYTSRGSTQREPNMTPMIDVVFLLMIYFVWSAGGQMAEHVLPSPVAAPQAGGVSRAPRVTPPEIDFEQVVVRVMWKNNAPVWSVAKDSFSTLQAVENRLSVIAKIKNDVNVVLHPQGEVPLGFVIELYDVALRAGFQKVQFAAQFERPKSS